MLRMLAAAAAGALLALAGAWFAWGPSAGHRAGIPGVGGNYAPVVHLPDVGRPLRIEVYSDFTCPACQEFELQGLDELEQRYGTKIEIAKRYLGNPRSESAKILYDLASSRQMGGRVARQLMEVGLSRSDDANNVVLVNAIAEENGLLEALEQAIADGSGRHKLLADWRSRPVHIEFLPYVVIANSIATDGNIPNVSRIVDDLLSRADDSAGN